MTKHVEMIEEYIKPDDGCGDYQWYDNHGILIRCKDCKYYTPVAAHCEIRGKGLYLIRGMEDFCSRAERRENESANI